MSDVGVHSFQIPHEYVQPVRDMIVVRIPLPPSKIGSILTPDITRDMMQHNVMAGRVVAMGPIAFCYKSGENSTMREDGTGGLRRHDVKVGDWVLFRPFSGTFATGGRVTTATTGWRYMSSFNDVIGVIPAAHMPAPETLEWEYDAPNAKPENPSFDFSNVREKVAV